MKKKSIMFVLLIVIMCVVSLTFFGCDEKGKTGELQQNSDEKQVDSPLKEDMTEAEILDALKGVTSFTLSTDEQEYEGDVLSEKETFVGRYTQIGYSECSKWMNYENGISITETEEFYEMLIIEGEKYYCVGERKCNGEVAGAEIYSDDVTQLAEIPSAKVTRILGNITELFDKAESMRVENGKLIIEYEMTYIFSNFNNTEITILPQYANYKELAN